MLQDAAWEPIGRHEAAEALAAIGGEGVAEVLTNTARTQSQRCGGHLIFTKYLHLPTCIFTGAGDVSAGPGHDGVPPRQ